MADDGRGLVVGKVQSVAKQASSKPIDVRVKRPPVNILAMVVQSIGGGPLVEHLVRIVDKDTGAPVGEPIRTDKDGKIRARVPEKKPYKVEIVDEGHALRPVPGAVTKTLPPKDPHQLTVLFVDGAGQPVAGEAVTVSADAGDPLDAKTDDQGVLDLPLMPGVCKLAVRGKTFWTHPIPFSHADGSPAYRFVLS